MGEEQPEGERAGQKVTLLGTGLMGSALAQRLGAQGYHVFVYNRTRTRAELLAGPRIVVVDTALEAVTRSERVLLTLSDEPAIRALVLAPEVRAHLTGRTLIQMGTISPAQSRQLSGELAALGALYIEAPVLGSLPEARGGTLIVMVGGEEQRFAEILELLRCFGPSPARVGPVGHAAALKLAMNQLIAALTTGFALSLGLVRRQGVALEQFMGLLRASALYAPTFDKKLKRMVERSFEHPNFPTKHLQKDIDLVLQEARHRGLRTDVVEGMARVLDACISAGLGDRDYSALYEVLDPVERD
jgi:3-hydroxyisobutyrate dehydrogenase